MTDAWERGEVGRSDSHHVADQSAVGGASHPRRTAEGGHRPLSGHRGEYMIRRLHSGLDVRNRLRFALSCCSIKSRMPRFSSRLTKQPSSAEASGSRTQCSWLRPIISRPTSSVVDAVTAIASRSGCRTAPRHSSPISPAFVPALLPWRSTSDIAPTRSRTASSVPVRRSS